jgi:hypothetical protein
MEMSFLVTQWLQQRTNLGKDTQAPRRQQHFVPSHSRPGVEGVNPYRAQSLSISWPRDIGESGGRHRHDRCVTLASVRQIRTSSPPVSVPNSSWLTRSTVQRRDFRVVSFRSDARQEVHDVALVGRPRPAQCSV